MSMSDVEGAGSGAGASGSSFSMPTFGGETTVSVSHLFVLLYGVHALASKPHHHDVYVCACLMCEPGDNRHSRRSTASRRRKDLGSRASFYPRTLSKRQQLPSPSSGSCLPLLQATRSTRSSP